LGGAASAPVDCAPGPPTVAYQATCAQPGRHQATTVLGKLRAVPLASSTTALPSAVQTVAMKGSGAHMRYPNLTLISPRHEAWARTERLGARPSSRPSAKASGVGAPSGAVAAPSSAWPTKVAATNTPTGVCAPRAPLIGRLTHRSCAWARHGASRAPMLHKPPHAQCVRSQHLRRVVRETGQGCAAWLP